jgi:hypothetical protein
MSLYRKVMTGEERLKEKVKPLLFSSATVARTVRFGPAKGVSLYLCRLDGLQLEFGLYETELHPIFSRTAADAGVIFDVGASAGYTTLLLGNVSANAQILSFEPDVSALALMERNLKLNPSIFARVRVVPLAVGRGTPAAGDAPKGQAGLDDLVGGGEIPAPDLIKVDVDGGELEVLSGAAQTLQAYRPWVVLETHSRELEDACVAFLELSHYSVRIVKNARWRLFWPEQRPIDHNRWLVARPEGVRVSAAAV